MMLKPVSD